MRVVLCTGFWQPERISNGLRDAEESIEALALPGVSVERHSYIDVDCIPKLAKSIVDAGEPAVGAAHSFGCWWQTLLADAIWGLGGTYHSLLFADGVGRKPRFSELAIAPSVQNFYCWRQSVSPKIKGSAIRLVDPSHTKWHIDSHVSVPHRKVDEEPYFQQLLLNIVKELSKS